MKPTYNNKPQHINRPYQKPLFTERYESRDCFLSGTPDRLDSEPVYVPWTVLGTPRERVFTATEKMSPLAVQYVAELHLNYMD